MKVVILAGGLGTRLSEETLVKPKPMVEIGGKPIIWHIMKIYSSYGFNDFIICLGYKGYLIKEYFVNYFIHQSDVSVCLASNTVSFSNSVVEPWRITLVETGSNTMTGARIRKVKDYLSNEPFLLTYGDGVADVDISALIKFHKKNGKILTVTAVQPQGRFGALDIDSDSNVTNFLEKPSGDGAWINGGFFVCEPSVFDFIEEDDSVVWEKDPLERITNAGLLAAYKHLGYWKPMDTLRDKNELEDEWNSERALWKKW